MIQYSLYLFTLISPRWLAEWGKVTTHQQEQQQWRRQHRFHFWLCLSFYLAMAYYAGDFTVVGISAQSAAAAAAFVSWSPSNSSNSTSGRIDLLHVRRRPSPSCYFIDQLYTGLRFRQVLSQKKIFSSRRNKSGERNKFKFFK